MGSSSTFVWTIIFPTWWGWEGKNWTLFLFLEIPWVLGQKAFRAASLEHLGRGTDAGGEPGCQIDKSPSVQAFFSRSQTFSPPKLICDVKNCGYKRRYITWYIWNHTNLSEYTAKPILSIFFHVIFLPVEEFQDTRGHWNEKMNFSTEQKATIKTDYCLIHTGKQSCAQPVLWPRGSWLTQPAKNCPLPITLACALPSPPKLCEGKYT